MQKRRKRKPLSAQIQALLVPLLSDADRQPEEAPRTQYSYSLFSSSGRSDFKSLFTVTQEPGKHSISKPARHTVQPTVIDNLNKNGKITFYFASASDCDSAYLTFLKLMDLSLFFRAPPKRQDVYFGFHPIKQKQIVECCIQPGFLILSCHGNWKTHGVNSRKSFAFHIASTVKNHLYLRSLIQNFISTLSINQSLVIPENEEKDVKFKMC